LAIFSRDCDFRQFSSKKMAIFFKKWQYSVKKWQFSSINGNSLRKMAVFLKTNVMIIFFHA
jgi:hypothetical protein